MCYCWLCYCCFEEPKCPAQMLLFFPGVDYSTGEGSGLRSVPAQGAVPVQQRAALWQDVHDAGRPRGRAGVLRPDHHRRSGWPEENHTVCLRSGNRHTPAGSAGPVGPVGLLIQWNRVFSCYDVLFSSVLLRWCSLGWARRWGRCPSICPGRVRWSWRSRTARQQPSWSIRRLENWWIELTNARCSSFWTRRTWWRWWDSDSTPANTGV